MIDQIVEQLKSNNISITPQRYALIEVLVNNRIHPTFNELYSLIKKDIKNTTKAALYNNIELLEKVGIIFEFSIYGEKHYDIIIEEHDHFICLKCKKIIDIHRKKSYNHHIKVGDVYYKSCFYFGICDECIEKGIKGEKND